MRVNLDGTAVAKERGLEIAMTPLSKAELAAHERHLDAEHDSRRWTGYREKDDTGATPLFTPRSADDERVKELNQVADAVKASIADSVNKSLEERAKAITENILAGMNDKFENLDAEFRTEIADRVKAAIAALPFGPRTVETVEWKERTDGKNGGICSMKLPRVKYHLDAEAVAGGRQDAIDAWTALVQGNPLRDLVMVVQLMGGTATLPNISAIAFANEANLPSGWPRAGAATTGALANTDITLKNYVAETYVSNAAMQDVPGLREVIQFEMMQQWGNTQGAQLIAAAKASVRSSGTGTFAAVTSGVNDAVPTDATVLGKIIDMIAEVEAAYLMGASFQIGRKLHSSLLKATSGSGGEYAFEPALGIRTIEGYPVRLNDHADASGANTVFGYFGNWRRGMILGEHASLIIADEYYETRPGAVTFFGQGRTVGVVRDGKAVSGLLEGT